MKVATYADPAAYSRLEARWWPRTCRIAHATQQHSLANTKTEKAFWRKVLEINGVVLVKKKKGEAAADGMIAEKAQGASA